ncbi:MAG: carboxypeptidase regulatory-like domain-containing protein, partial [Calditrichaeota bacterium]|nr:carboxypeptidase regulatory-like domain-containing protein [Calditrichota bacterium]
ITGTIRLVDESGQSSRSVTLYQKIDGYYSQYGGLVEWLMVAPQTLALGQKDFHFRGLAADEYRICAYAYLDGQESNECYDNVSDLHDATSISVTAGTVISNITMLLMDGADWAMITGTVKSASGEPLAGIDLYVAGTGAPPIDQSMSPSSKQPEQAWRIAAASSPWGALPHATAANAIPNSIPAFPLSYRTSTDENGNYAIKFLTAGPYQVLFYDSIGRYRYEFYDDVTFSANSTMIAVRQTEIISNVNVSLDVGGQITGRVSVWGQPAPNAQLYLHKAENGGWFPVSYTSVDPFTGSYAFRGLPAGRYRVQASAFILYPPISTYYLYGMYGGDNWGTATDIKLAAAETKSDIDIAMSQGPHFDGAISGKVTANGKPLANVQVGLYNPYGCCHPFVIGPPPTYAATDAD